MWAKVQWTFANWQNSSECISESLIGEIPISRTGFASHCYALNSRIKEVSHYPKVDFDDLNFFFLTPAHLDLYLLAVKNETFPNT
jgi:hypothetical protein